MKKYIYPLIFLMMAMVSVGFAACGDDDEPKGSDIVGTWALDDTGFGAAVILFQFTKDGKFHEVNKSMLNGETGVDVYHGTYTVSGTKLIITYDPDPMSDPEPSECEYSVQGDRLKLLAGDYPTFTRVEDSVIQPYL